MSVWLLAEVLKSSVSSLTLGVALLSPAWTDPAQGPSVGFSISMDTGLLSEDITPWKLWRTTDEM